MPRLSRPKNEEENKKGRRALAVLRLLGLFDRPVTADCFYALLKAPAIPNLTELLVEKKEEPRRIALARLEAAKLLTVSRGAAGALVALDSHPLLREYFAKQICEQHPNSWCEAHRRVYKHLISTTNEGDKPVLEDLQPLYQAVAHGCQGGMAKDAFEKVYYARIQKEQQFYSVKKLGAIGSDLSVIACFFKIPWSKLLFEFIETDQGFIFHVAAYSLGALGRLTEAVEPMRAGLKIADKQYDWQNAARSSVSLSEFEVTLGELKKAARDSEYSVICADRTKDDFLKIISRAGQAAVLHQTGCRSESASLYCEAEEVQAKYQPQYPELYSVQGFRYLDLLLASAEEAAWKAIFLRGSLSDCLQSPSINGLRNVSRRVARMFDMTRDEGLILDIALVRLVMSRVALYERILLGATQTICYEFISQAMDGLRRSGQSTYLIRGLLTRAWIRSIEGNRFGGESAQSDLDEAWEIAERGPMPLFMADIHLHRARLFFCETTYPWESPQADLAEARRLIEKHGYWRRKEELEDAESVILRKP